MSLTKVRINLGTQGNLSGSRSIVQSTKTLVSGSAQIASNISGSFTSTSSSIASGIAGNLSSINTLNGSGTAQGVGTSDSPTFNNITATGTLTAQEIHTEFTSASILFTSGSTQFGNSSDDVHNMTGSLNVSGSLFVKDGTLTVTDNVDFNGDLDVDGTTNLDVVDIDGAVDMASTLAVANTLTVTTDNENVARFDGLQGNIDFRYGSDIEFDRAGQVYITANNGSGELNFRTGGQNIAMHIDSSQNVGIGTASPGHLLTVAGATDGDNPSIHIVAHSSDSGSIFFGESATNKNGGIEYDNGGQDMYFTTNSSRKMTLDTSGNLGIGTTGPGATLHVDNNSSTAYNGAAEIAETVIFRNKNGSDGSGVNNVVSIGLQVADGATSQGFLNFKRTGDNTGYFTFTSRTGSSEYKELLWINGATNNWALNLTANSPYGMQITTTSDGSSSHDAFVIKRASNTKVFEIFNNGLLKIYGNIIPQTDNAYDLGSSSLGWRNIYTNDLNLSNMKSDGNDVDGTKGSWTIQEGEDDLFLINRTNGKKYKFKLETV